MSNGSVDSMAAGCAGGCLGLVLLVVLVFVGLVVLFFLSMGGAPVACVC